MSLVGRLMGACLSLLVRAYRYCISPLFPGCCRFHPTCSQYMLILLQQGTLARAVYHGSRRLLRCHPWHPGGVDWPPTTKDPHHVA